MKNIYDGFTFVKGLSLNNTSGTFTTQNNDDYIADFYGLKRGEGVDLNKLIPFLKLNDSSKINYTNFFRPYKSSYEFIGTDGVMEVERLIDIPFTYKNNFGQTIEAEISCGINKRIDYVVPIYYPSLAINYQTEKIEVNIVCFYKNTEQFRTRIENKESQKGFTINDKFAGIKIISRKPTDIYYLLKEIEGKNGAEWYPNYVNEKFIPLLKNAKDVKELIWLYENAPDFTLVALEPEFLWKHISQFYNYDVAGTFSFLKDASQQLIRALFAFNSLERISYLMKKLKENQGFVSQLYEALDDEISFIGQKIPCKIALISVLSSFATVSKDSFNFTNEFFIVGGEYRVIVEMLQNPTKKSDNGKYKLSQQIKTGTGLASSIGGGVSVPYNIYNTLHPVELFPLDMVSILQDETQSLLSVPALFLENEQYQKDMEALGNLIRLGVDMLAIALAVETLGSSLLATEVSAGGYFFATLAAIEGTLALGDIGIQLNKDKLAKEFLETWEKIYIVGGVSTASPYVVAGLYKLGGKILASSAKIEVKNFVQSCMMKMFLEREISNCMKNTVKILKTNTEIVEATKGALTEAKARVLNQYSLIIIEGEFKTGKTVTKEAALVYKGEIILHANRYDFFNKSYPLLKNINHEKEFIKLADELLVYGKEYPVNTLKPLITEAQAMSQYGNAGKALVNTVDKEVQHILQNFIKADIEQKVMVSGMVYKKGFPTKYFIATNFLKKEIDNGIGKVYVDFIKNLHPTLQIRLDKHIAKLKMNGVLATKNDLLRAGKMGSHGEIRALDKLLREVDPQGKLGEAVFQEIVGYNRFLWNIEKIQPPCVHCYYLTAGVKFIGF